MAATSTEIDPRTARLIRLIDAEFDEMPGMRLTPAQVRRLWNASKSDCDAALGHLQSEGRLVCDGAGRYRRRGGDY